MKATESGKHLRKIRQQENSNNNSKKRYCWNAQISWNALCAWDCCCCYYMPLSAALAAMPHAAVTLAWLVQQQVQCPARLRQSRARWQIQLALSFSSNHHHRQLVSGKRQAPTGNCQLWCAKALLPPSRWSHSHSLLFLISLGKPISIWLVLITIEINTFCIKNT